MSARTPGTPPVRATAEQSAEVFAALRAILSAHAKELKVAADGPKGYSLNTPYSDRWKKELFFGGVQVTKNYVSFHLFPVYMFPDLLEGTSAELKARMQGKSCFSFRAPDPALFVELAALVATGLARMKAERAF
ncbi:MAG: hypothetical protein ACYDBY_02555 [Thermoanaerobaculia bacterium]